MNELALFAGAGGGILGGKLLGWRTVCAVEWEPYPASVLCARQNDGFLPPFPIWDDVQTFDGRPWAGIVVVVSGGFTCQDISAAGKGAGIDGERSGMWREMARIIREVRPRYAFVENSPMLTSRGLGVVLADLASMGFDARWGVLGAADVGANHQRDRIWIVARWRGNLPHAQHDEQSRNQSEMANTRCELWEQGNSTRLEACQEIGSASPIHDQSSGQGQAFANANGAQCERVCKSERIQQEHPYACDSRWWQTEPNVGRMVDGLASGTDRLKAIGNGQVPLCAATAFRILSQNI